jgi:hypothetical protein
VSLVGKAAGHDGHPVTRGELLPDRLLGYRPSVAVRSGHQHGHALEFWQRQTPEARWSALVAIRDDIRRVKGRNKAAAWES